MIVEIIRHGETALQRERRYQGTTDVPLSAEGRAALAPADERPRRVWVSPLLRARQTAEILFPAAEQIEVSGLAEMDFGVFEGRNAAEMEYDADYRTWVDGFCLGRCPGGESKEEFSLRVCQAVEALLDGAVRDGEEAIWIVAHGGTMMAALERFGRPARSYYDWLRPSGAGWRLDAGRWMAERTLHLLGPTDHRRGGERL